MRSMLDKLTRTFAPSGSEDGICKLIQDEIRDYVDEIYVDVMGNLIACKKGKGKKIMLAAHMDQIGLIITSIDKNGFLRFLNIGGVSVYNLIHRRVIFKDGLTGIIGYETEHDDWKSIQLNKMYIDIGAVTREDAEKVVRIGDAAVYDSPLTECQGKYAGAAMDNRVGCLVLIETIKRVKHSPHEIYYVFTVQEELGLRGAKTSAFSINPDIGIAVDVTLTGDTPKARSMSVKLGAGPAIKVKDTSLITHPKVREHMVKKAEEAGIPYQMEVLEAGGTDAGAIHLTREGVPSGALSIPCRYVHSANEMVDAGDIEGAIILLTKILEDMID